MASIRIDLINPPTNGQTITFRSPLDCSEVTSLKIYHTNGTKPAIFLLADAHGNNVGSVDLFAENVIVKVILDTANSRAYVQNADTNAYLEGQLAEKLPKSGGEMSGSVKLDTIVLKRGVNYGTETEMHNIENPVLGQLFFVQV